MNSVESIYKEIEKIKILKLVDSVRIEVLRKNVLKAKLYFSENLFIQVYRNDIYQTTNFALILNRKRIYARDEFKGKWHRHPLKDPSLHNGSEDGKMECNFQQFWKEIIEILNDIKVI